MNLYLDDIRSPPPNGNWTVVRSVSEAQRALEQSQEPFENASLDHDLGYTYCRTCAFKEPEESCEDGNGQFTCGCSCHVEAPSGMDFLKWMAETGRWPLNKPTVHSANYPAAERMRRFVEENGPYGKQND